MLRSPVGIAARFMLLALAMMCAAGYTVDAVTKLSASAFGEQANELIDRVNYVYGLSEELTGDINGEWTVAGYLENYAGTFGFANKVT